jgi:sigma-E factor negative regulatory protein RseA
MNEELDSQLSAMFDDELPSGECELLARRLSRDEALKARWGRYALIGAVIRAERGVVLQSAVAGRVNAALSHEPQLAPGTHGVPRASAAWMRMLSGAGLAAGVAALSILWLRAHHGGPLLGAAPMTVASVAATPVVDGVARRRSRGPDSYVVPPSTPAVMTPMPPTQLADYVVAHSAYSWPISGGSLLSSLMVSEAAASPPAAPRRRAVRQVAGHGHVASQPH